MFEISLIDRRTLSHYIANWTISFIPNFECRLSNQLARRLRVDNINTRIRSAIETMTFHTRADTPLLGWSMSYNIVLPRFCFFWVNWESRINI